MSKLVAVRLPEETLHNVDRERKKNHLTRSAVIKLALDAWVQRQRYEADMKRDRDAYDRHPVNAEEFRSLIAAQVWPK
jgi:Arc/MetJ-type ribon-helix-helix transcriptional regulator